MNERRGRYYSIPAPDRDAMIIQLKRRGWTNVRIGRRVGMSESGVRRAVEAHQSGQLRRRHDAGLRNSEFAGKRPSDLPVCRYSGERTQYRGAARHHRNPGAASIDPDPAPICA